MPTGRCCCSSLQVSGREGKVRCGAVGRGGHGGHGGHGGVGAERNVLSRFLLHCISLLWPGQQASQVHNMN